MFFKFLIFNVLLIIYTILPGSYCREMLLCTPEAGNRPFKNSQLVFYKTMILLRNNLLCSIPEFSYQIYEM